MFSKQYNVTIYICENNYRDNQKEKKLIIKEILKTKRCMKIHILQRISLHH